MPIVVFVSEKGIVDAKPVQFLVNSALASVEKEENRDDFLLKILKSTLEGSILIFRRCVASLGEAIGKGDFYFPCLCRADQRQKRC